MEPTTGLVSRADWLRGDARVEGLRSTKMACQTQNTSTVHTLREWSASPRRCASSSSRA